MTSMVKEVAPWQGHTAFEYRLKAPGSNRSSELLKLPDKLLLNIALLDEERYSETPSGATTQHYASR
jgi:hypothetical protein